jgi:hypothetical protein
MSCLKGKNGYRVTRLPRCCSAGNATGLCDKLFGDAFVYDASNQGLVMNFPEGQPNPNDKVHENVVPPEPCADHKASDEKRKEACGDKARDLSLLAPCLMYKC